MFSVAKVAAAALLFALRLGFPERFHHSRQFLPEAFDLRLLVLDLPAAFGKLLVHGFLLLDQFRVLRFLVVLELLLQHLLLLGVGPLHFLLPRLELQTHLLLFDLNGSLLGIQHFVHLHAEGLDLLQCLGLRLLDLLLDRGLRFLNLLPGLLLRFPDLGPCPLLLHLRSVLGLRDLLVDRPLLSILVHIEEHPELAAVVVRAAYQIDVRPTLRSVLAFHLEDSQIGVFGILFQMRLGQPLPGIARHFQTVERVFRDLVRESGHAQAELFREFPAHVDGMPVP